MVRHRERVPVAAGERLSNRPANGKHDRVVLLRHRRAETSGGTKTSVPCGASDVSSPTVNFARPRRTTYISSLPASSVCGGLS